MPSDCIRHITERYGRPSKMARPRVYRDGKQVHTARLVWEKHHGKALGDMDIHHECLNSWCQNPEHLRAVTATEHQWIHQALMTECRNGHPWTPANTCIDPQGTRYCRQCHNIKMKKYKRLRSAREPGWRKRAHQ